MYQHILLPCDGSDLSLKAVNEGIALAKVLGAKITLITVMSPYRLHVSGIVPDNVAEEIGRRHDEASRKETEKLQIDVVAKAKAQGVACDALVVKGDHPYAEIIATAEARKCDLILMASHGHKGLNAILLGSETVKVLTHSKIPVLVVR